MALSKLAVRRLTKLADFMDSLPASARQHFAMRDFLSHNDNHAHKIKGYATAKDLHTCGTTACALGWAATMPYFRRLGLRMDQYGDVSGDGEVFDLASDFYEHWSALFGGHLGRIRTPKQWAKHCREYILEHAA